MASFILAFYLLTVLVVMEWLIVLERDRPYSWNSPLNIFVTVTWAFIQALLWPLLLWLFIYQARNDN